MLITGQVVEYIDVLLPNNEKVQIKIHNSYIDNNIAHCEVIKDAGDDPDVTNGIEICAVVKFNDINQIIIDGGIGVGRVTQKGLDCEVGQAAINSTPRQMIMNNTQRICYMI